MSYVITAQKILGSLISFNTVSAFSNKALINFVTAYLNKFGLNCDIAYNENGTKADIVATIGPTG